MKTLEFINSRRPDLEIRANFLQQVQQYTKRAITFLNFKDRVKPLRKKVERTEEWNQLLSDLPMYKIDNESNIQIQKQNIEF